jgi:uracil-DNA glycosylase family 4
MKKSKVAENLNSLLYSCMDYYNGGFSGKHEQYDFTSLDTKPVQEENTPGETSKTSPSKGNKSRVMIELARKIISCTACPLGNGTSQIVPGMGNIDADVFVISAPVAPSEEQYGKPLHGADGEFFAKWMEAIGLSQETLFLTNIIKCNGRGTRLTKEMYLTCMEHLKNQLDIVKPMILLTLGNSAISALRQERTDITRVHGQVFYYEGYPLVPTWHPAEVQNNPSLKKQVWQDLQKFQVFLEGRKIDGNHP